MTTDFALDMLRAMVSIPSYSGREQQLATYMADAMSHLGYQTTIDAVGNVIGETGNRNGPLVLLLGHMDTVPGEIPVREEEGVLYGRGVVDAKGSLATLVMAGATLHDAPARVVVVGAVEEETPGSRGARALLDRYTPKAVIVGEPSSWASVTLGYKGKVDLTLELSRPPSHSAGPGEKASDMGVLFWNQLVQHLRTFGREDSKFYQPTATLTSIVGSTEYARLHGVCRVPPKFDLDAFVDFVRTISQDGGLWFDEVTPAVVTKRSTPPAKALVSAIRRQGVRPSLKFKTGTSDMNIVAHAWGVPTVAYGPGDSSLSHTTDELLELSEYLRTIAVLTDGLTLLVDELQQAYGTGQENGVDDSIYTPEEEAALTRRLQSLGYLE